ncbi:MAG: hypothetical protein AAF689_13560 [Pseudomonadota bacterium]
MKSLAAAAGLAILVAGAPALAGGIAPQTPEVLIIDDTVASNGGILVPIMALVMALAAFSN